ncbi:OVARIAN TUMOR DOMAIN-containing deubiquitinating enzyme 12 [Asimina triloba]
MVVGILVLNLGIASMLREAGSFFRSTVESNYSAEFFHFLVVVVAVVICFLVIIEAERIHITRCCLVCDDFTDTEDDKMIAVVLSEEYAQLDGVGAKRLSHLQSIPAINGYMEHDTNAVLTGVMFYVRLNVYGLYEVKVSGDGNCQFRAISDQMYRSPEHHKHVRKEIVKQLKDSRSLYEGYVPMKYKKYYKKMAKSGEWGDHVTLQAAADKVKYMTLLDLD